MPYVRAPEDTAQHFCTATDTIFLSDESDQIVGNIRHTEIRTLESVCSRIDGDNALDNGDFFIRQKRVQRVK